MMPSSLLRLMTEHIIVMLLLTRPGANGQEPLPVHPWLTECQEWPCFMNYFCNVSNGICEPCPYNGTNVSQEDCYKLNVTNSSTIDECLSSCVRPQEGEECSNDNVCDEGNFFCNFEDVDNLTVATGTCEQCKDDASECLFDDTIKSNFGVEDCLLCDLRVCLPLHFSITRVGGENVSSHALQGSPSLFASGPLVGCTNLVHDDETTCDDNADARGAVCLVEDYTRYTYYVGVVNKCADLGGVGMILYGDYSHHTPNNESWTGSLSYKPSTIPSVSIPYSDGRRLYENELGAEAQIDTSDAGNVCIKRQFCSEDIPCVGSSEGRYCDYKWGGDEGWCRDCPVGDDGNPAPLKCFFSFDDLARLHPQKAVESCSKVCASELTFPDCKFCPKDVSGFDFGVESEADRCDFCPEDDVMYPDKDFPLFGEGVKCWQVKKFFDSVEVHKDSTNCQLAQMVSYVCGCAGGYGGASTNTKQAVLVWLPRVMAILSILGSSFIIYDASKTKERRRKLLNRLLITLSAFDICGSCAYALTTLPTPANDWYGLYGAHGNRGTCVAQGFFIQLGTISAYTNVSLAFYYLFIIKYGWNERNMKKLRWLLFLCPLTVGFAFAFAGIPFYSSMLLWCNNTASYWPELPITVAIAIATVVMGSVCCDVSQKDRASRRWRGGAGAGASIRRSTSMSTRVFWQSFWYLMAFYLTWPVYLALQFSWSGGQAFTNYGFILAAGTMVPLQGFWNLIVYTRPRHVHRAVKRFSTRFTGSMTPSVERSHKSSTESRSRASIARGSGSVVWNSAPLSSSEIQLGQAKAPEAAISVEVNGASDNDQT